MVSKFSFSKRACVTAYQVKLVALASHLGVGASPICSTSSVHPCCCAWEGSGEYATYTSPAPPWRHRRSSWLPALTRPSPDDYDYWGMNQETERLFHHLFLMF